jgi:proliferating cell nuclear antigen
MDGSHVALVNMFIDATKIEKYHCKQMHMIGLSVATMVSCLKPIGNFDTLTWEVYDNTPDILNLQISNNDKKRTHDYAIKLIDIDCEMLEIPAKDFSCVMTMPSSDMQHIIRDLHHVGDKIRIKSGENDLSMSATGDDASLTVSLKQSVEGCTITNIRDVPVDNSFASRYLTFFTKAASLSQWVEIYLDQSYPMTIKYNVASLGHLQFCLAPCIE